MKKDARKSLFQGPLLYVVLLLVILWMVHLLGTPAGTQPLELSYSSLLQWVEADLKHTLMLRHVERLFIGDMHPEDEPEPVPEGAGAKACFLHVSV